MPVTEADVLRACLDVLSAMRILAFRMNCGLARIDSRFVRFGVPGMADVLAFPTEGVLWIECKVPRGQQSDLQRSFEQQVRAHGHEYLLMRCPEDLMHFLTSKKQAALV